MEQAVRLSERGERIILIAQPWEPNAVPLRVVLKEVSVSPAAYYGIHDGVDEFTSPLAFSVEAAATARPARPKATSPSVANRSRSSSSDPQACNVNHIDNHVYDVLDLGGS
jgi:hypothetical protein